MAADQWRKRLNSAGVVGFHGREQYRAKRKNTGFPQYDPNMKSHISLEWDGNQKRVVARRDQISISRRDMWPFMRSSPSVNNPIADVFSVPQEIYTLENLNDVLSCEVAVGSYFTQNSSYTDYAVCSTHENCRSGRHTYLKVRETILCSFFLGVQRLRKSWKHC